MSLSYNMGGLLNLGSMPLDVQLNRSVAGLCDPVMMISNADIYMSALVS